ncbi:MAG: hypothetical protein HRU03_06675 [Nanoarchaeales archaeon]|nr:hypothetical protein [Nanoarchaeales archaeon]
MDKEAVRGELNTVRAEIRSLKSEFSKKRNEKEDHFKKGEDYSTEIDKLYNEVKAIESEHGLEKINTDLESMKKEYDELKPQLDAAEKNFTHVKKTSPRIAPSSREGPVVKTISAERAKTEIKQLETSLQTQVLSLDKESGINKRITELREIVGNQSSSPVVSDNSGSSEEFKVAKKELFSVKKKFINVERRIRSLYKQIRLVSKEKKIKYKLIDDLRAQKKASFDEFKTHKKSYTELGKTLKDLFKKEEDYLSQLGEAPVQRKRTRDVELKAKQKEVESDFMKKGKTLTTEDLLMLQIK